jgi:hypothetical protein
LYAQEGVHNGRVRASVVEMVDEDAETIASRRGPELFEGAGQLDDVAKVPWGMSAGVVNLGPSPID